MMADYVLEGPRWGVGSSGTSAGTVTWAIGETIPASFVGIIQSAFSAWSSYGNIKFQQILSTNTSNIDFDLKVIDGLSNVLGNTNYSYIGQHLQSAIVTFDSGENWRTSGSKIVSGQNVDLYIVALHEIGHAIGLDHYNSKTEAMNSYLSPGITGLMAGDISGVQALYGQPVGLPPVSVGNGPTATQTTSASLSDIAHLYYGILDRAPDAAGLQNWAAATKAGMSLHDVAAALLGSSEYEVATTGLTDAQFVDTMYSQILGRSGDAGGVQNWNNYLDHSGARGTVINGFTDSLEFQGKYAGQSSAAYVEQLYEHVLGRNGDTSGLQAWSGAIDSHALSRTDVAHAFTGSAEFQTKYVEPSNADFVDDLYENALGRHAEAGGLQGWTDLLVHGTSPANVAVAIAESAEAQHHLITQIETSWHSA